MTSKFLNTSNENMLNDRWLRLLGVPFIALVLPLVFFREDLEAGIPFHIAVLVSFLFSISQWEVNRNYFRYTANRFPAPEEHTKRIVWLVIGSAILSFIVSITIDSALRAIEKTMQWHLCTDEDTLEKMGTTYLLVFAVSSLYESRRMYEKWKTTDHRRDVLEKESAQYELARLKQQMNPHFLFNSLNALIQLIQNDPVIATDFVRRLATLLRKVLTLQDKNLHSLAEELDVLEDYTYLMKQRFVDGLQVQFIGTPTLDAFLPPLSLQLLIENAIKHNVTSQSKPLQIQISFFEDHIEICNPLQLKTQDMHHEGIGLSNLNARYQLISNQSIHFGKKGQDFCVSLPLVKVKSL